LKTQIDTYLPVIPIYLIDNKTLFNYYNENLSYGVAVMSIYTSSGSYYPIFNISRRTPSIKLQAGNKQYLLSLSEEGFKLYNDTDGLGYEISLQYGLSVTHGLDKLQISNQGDKTASASQKITIPYRTDLTNYNKYTFHQSIIDNIGNSYNTITDNQKYPAFIKILASYTIYPRTTNTIITLYYSSYIIPVQRMQQ
jgi:hypothetical protein